MPDLKLYQIQAQHQGDTVVNRVSIDLSDGEIGCLLGPSGCGKTTILRSIAGLHPLTGGQIYLGENCLSNQSNTVPTEQRRIGMVFQDYALFPHMTIADNIAFGLTEHNSASIKTRIKQLLTLIGLPEIGKRYPHQLSGGQQQRAALARALAPKPQVLLMDEPFSGLDVELRESLAREVRQILKAEGMSALMVTHNQNEAFAMADSVGVIQEGKLLQWDTPYNLYHQPRHPFIADFIGQGVLISGNVCDCRAVHTALGTLKTHLPFGTATGEAVSVLVRPDDILHDDDSDWQLEVVNRAFRGSHYLFTLKLNAAENILCMSQSHHNHPIGSKVGIKLEMDHAIVFPKQKHPL